MKTTNPQLPDVSLTCARRCAPVFRSAAALLGVAILFVATQSARAAWTLLDNFDGYATGATSAATTNSWSGVFVGTGNANIIASDQGKSLQTKGGAAWRGNEKNITGTAGVPVNALKTIFFQFKPISTGGSFDVMMGLAPSVSNIDENNAWQDFSVMPFFAGGACGVADLKATRISPAADVELITNPACGVWYNVWLVVSNNAVAPYYEVWTSTGTNAGTLALANAAFRNLPINQALNAIGFMAAGGAGSEVLHDNIYYTDGKDTSNPLVLTLGNTVLNPASPVAKDTVVTASATVSGGLAPRSYQWQSSPDDSTWSSITDATNSTYQPGTSSAGTTYYRLIASDSYSPVQRVTNASAQLVVLEAAAPSVTAFVNPASATRHQAVTLTAVVAPGSGDIASVTADLTQIGGSPAASLVLSNDFVYTNTFVVPASTTVGMKSLGVTVTDDTLPTALTDSDAATLTISAVSRAWDGGASTDDNWTSSENWTGDASPGLVGDSVTFAGTTRLTPNLDASYSVTGLAFDNTAGSFNLGTANSSVLTFTAGTGIVNDSANAQMVSAPVVLAAAQTLNAAAGDVTLSGPVTGTGSLTKTGNRTLTLSGNVTSSGQFTFNGGTSVVAAVLAPMSAEVWVGDTAGNTGVLNVASGAMVVASNWVAVGRNSANGTVNINGGTLIKQTTSGNLTTAGIGTTQTGTINLNGGVISNAVSETWIGETGTGVYNQTAGTAHLGAALRISYLASSGFANVSGGTLTAGLIGIGDGANNAQPGTGILNISGGAVVNATNGLRLGFAGNSSKFGYLTNNGGTLNVSGGDGMVVTRWDATRAHVVHQTGAINLLNNASLTFGQSGNTGEGSLTQSGGTVTFFSDAGVTPGGSGSVDLRGGGGGAYTYHLNGGTLTTPRVQKSGASGSGIFNFNGGTLKATATSATFLQGLTRANVRDGGAIFDTGNFAVTVAQALLHSNVGGDADTDGGLTKLGTGSLILSGANTFTGPVDVQAGEIQIGNATALGTTNSGTTVAAGAQLAIYSSLTVQEPLTLNGAGPSGGAIRQGGNSTVTFGGPMTLGSDATIRIDGGCTVTVTNLVDTAGHVLTWLCDNTAGAISGEITGAGGFSKISSGTVTLSGANTYNGATTVSNGTLTLAGSIASGGSVSVAGGTLRGTGSIGSPVSVLAGGTLTAGAGAIGTLSINNDVTLAGTTALKINKAAGPALTSDLVTGVGTLNCGGTVTVSATGDSLAVGDEFTVFSAANFTGAFTSIAPAPGAGLAWDSVRLRTQGVLAVHANPIPGAAEAGAVHGQTISIPVVKVLSNAVGEPGETLSVIAVGANASLAGGIITYTAPASGASDVISYTLSDGRGGTASGSITVTLSPAGEGFNRLSAENLGGNTLRLTYLGIPGEDYALDWATNLIAPVAWTPVATNVAAPNGYLIFTNTGSGTDFYRTRHVP